MEGIPLCVPYTDKIVGRIVLDPEYEERFAQALMDDVKFYIGAAIDHSDAKPKLRRLNFIPEEAIISTEGARSANVEELYQKAMEAMRRYT